MSFRGIISAASTNPIIALSWVAEIEEARTIEQLHSSIYLHEGTMINFETLDMKIAAGIMKVMHGDFKKRVTMKDEQHQMQRKKMLTGRQVAFMMFQHFQLNDLDSSMMEFNDLLSLELKGDNLRAFDTAWDNTLLGMKNLPDEEYLENLYRKQVRKSKQFEQLYSQLEADHVLRNRPRTYHDLKALVRYHLDKETRDRHLESKRRAHERGLAGMSSRKAGDCHQWLKAGSCSKGDDCPFNHPEDRKGAGKSRGRGRAKARSRGKGVGAEGSSGPESDTVTDDSVYFRICADYLKGKCEKGDDCPFRHPENVFITKKGVAKGARIARFCIPRLPPRPRKPSGIRKV